VKGKNRRLQRENGKGKRERGYGCAKYPNFPSDGSNFKGKIVIFLKWELEHVNWGPTLSHLG